MTPCKFTFDDTPPFEGFAHGSTWNGFDNVAVTAKTHAQVIAYFRSIGGDTSDLELLDPMPDGLISYGWGFSTQIVDQ